MAEELPRYLKAGLASTTHTQQPLPVLLCLHGGGTNATGRIPLSQKRAAFDTDLQIVYNIQAMRLQRLLCNTFNLIFLDGPMPTRAGAGVLPVFEGCDPFFRWFRAGKDVNVMPPETRAQVKRALSYIEGEHEAGILGPVVGFMGFSQGAKLGAGLLWEQMVNGAESGWDFKFGVMCNAIAPPMCEVKEEDKMRRVTIPTLHVVGEEDPWRESSRKLYDEYFEKGISNKLEFPNGHRLPTADEETKKIADEILRMWQSCGSQKEDEKVSEKESLNLAASTVTEVVA
jgi:predicted esterase